MVIIRILMQIMQLLIFSKLNKKYQVKQIKIAKKNWQNGTIKISK